jgi:two-component system sensor histidine kinase KdpD
MMKFTVRQRATLMRVGKILAFAGAVLGTTKLTLAFSAVTSASTAAFSFLIIVILSAYFGDLLVAITTSLVAALCYDYFYLPPFGTLNIAAFPDWISLAAFLLASVVISRLAASAAENGKRANGLHTALAQLESFGEWLLSMPDDQLTLSGIAKEATHRFALEYCSIHVYGEGKWQHFTGSAASDIFRGVEQRLEVCQDHARNLLELADEHLLGVQYVQIDKGAAPLALLAVKSKTLPADAIGAIAHLIGMRLTAMPHRGGFHRD